MSTSHRHTSQLKDVLEDEQCERPSKRLRADSPLGMSSTASLPLSNQFSDPASSRTCSDQNQKIIRNNLDIEDGGSDNNNNLSLEDESLKDGDSSQGDDEDDIVLSEVHIDPINGRVDGRWMVSLFQIGKAVERHDKRHLANTEEQFEMSWEYAVEIRHAMGTTLKSVGSQVWMGSFLLVDWMSSIKDQLNGSVAFELGAGTGLTSIALSLLTGVERIFCTDYDTDVLLNCERNVINNSHLVKTSESDGSTFFNNRILPRTYNWLMDDPMDSSSCTSTPERFDWSKEEIEQWRSRGTFIFAADVVYDDSLTDALIRCLEKLLLDPLPKDHPRHDIGRIAYLTMEKRYNFSLDELDVVAQAHDYFVKKMSQSNMIEAQRIDCTELDHYCDYKRSKDLVRKQAE
ncbi:hypothetical protein BCR41DRAFT_227418 [Lobosporangium transversale]|uniref:Methyltransferase-domain-containing protein n=1 Tax=Lobosporangium transversale TaxID=64571 RepID=A0A1Y2G6K9_9FUNG|nr:hypothetical protein BCR41DRAFT_227418 [Lobosporangium transversale]ORY98270.1 hypothetical protein BCR41DRAFT_227418 [Lobosporangium transversale]|eukprot:XP_021875699.1 hypothetical protein BCR41DRAFT_227418 [Lobosporangium transversale]